MSKPTLWHIEISHYSEKARWALDYKGIEHQRRAPTPGAHIAVALWLTRGRCKTFPVLQLDGEAIGDSTAIIAALEERYPDPPLYPDDPGERRRALELEEFFDEELGPHARLLAFHEATKDLAVVERFTVDLLPGRLADIGPSPGGGDALLLSLHRPSLRGEERSPGGAREGQDPGGLRSARIRPRFGRLPRRRPASPSPTSPRPRSSTPWCFRRRDPRFRRPRRDSSASARPSRSVPATGGCRRCSAATGSRRPRRRPPDYRFTELRRSPRPRPGRRTGARRPRSPSGRDGRPHPRARGSGP